MKWAGPSWAVPLLAIGCPWSAGGQLVHAHIWQLAADWLMVSWSCHGYWADGSHQPRCVHHFCGVGSMSTPSSTAVGCSGA